MEKIKNKYTLEELNDMELKDIIKTGLLNVELFAHINGYHGQKFYHIDELDEIEKKHFQKENNNLWTDDYVVLIDTEDADNNYPCDYYMYGMLEYLEIEIWDSEYRKEEYIESINWYWNE